MAKLVVRFLIPYRTLQYQKSYFEAIRLIEAVKCRDAISDEQRSYYHWMQTRFQLANWFILLKFIHFATLWIYPLQSQPILAAFNADLIGMAKLDNNLQILIVLFFGLIHFYFGRKLFVTYHPYLLGYFYDLTFGDCLGQVFLSPFRYRGKDIQRRLQQSVFYTLNILQIFPLGVHCVCAFLQYQGLLAIVTNWNNFDTWKLPWLDTPISCPLAITLTFIYFEFWCLLFSFIFYDLVLIGTLGLACVAIVLTISFILFGQITQRCGMMLRSRWVAHRLVTAIQFSRRSIVFILQVVPYYSEQMGVFMLVNVPLNGYLLGILLYGQLEFQWVPVVLLFMAHQWLVIFGLHLLAIRFNYSLTKPNRTLIALAVKRRFPIRTTLLLSAYLEAFHSRKRYGLGYSQFGLISMLAFCKTILLYGEFVMVTYKMVTLKLFQ